MVFPSAIVETKNLFIYIAKQMERLNRDVRSVQASFQKRPEVFDSVGVNLTANIFVQVIHNLMNILLRETIVSNGLVSKHLGTMLNMLKNRILQSLALDVRNHTHANFARLAVEDSMHSSLARKISFVPCIRVVRELGTNLLQSNLAALVHVLSLSSDKGFVNFDRPSASSELLNRTFAQSKTQTLQDEPCGLLSHADGTSKFVAADSVLAVNEHPESDKPLIKTDGRVLEDRAQFHRELFMAFLALPALLSSKVVMLSTFASDTDRPIRPAKGSNGVNAGLCVRKVLDGFLQSLGLIGFTFHDGATVQL